MAGAPQSSDIALALVAASVRAALDASRVALMPARVAMRAPVVHAPLRRVQRVVQYVATSQSNRRADNVSVGG